MAERILVPFHGPGAGSGELTWGQREIWREMRFTGVPLNMGGVRPVQPGVTVADVARTMSFVIGRHPSLRTRFLIDRHGEPYCQVLSDHGDVPLEIVDADDDPLRVADEIRGRYREIPFDYPREWPVRMAIVRHRGAPTYFVAVYCHLTTDAYGLMHVLVPDLANVGTDEPNTGMSPLTQAKRQANSRRQSDAALKHWAKALRLLPATRFPHREPESHRYWDVAYRSPATYEAAHAIADSADIDTTPVLLAAFAVVLGRITRQDRIGVQLMVGNRFRPGFAETVSPVAQTGLCAIDVGGVRWDEALTRAWQASMTAYLNAYYDPRRRDELVAEIGAERGETIDVSCFLNHRKQPKSTPAQPVARAEPVWDAPPVKRNERLFVSIDDRPGSMDYSVGIDTCYMSRADTEALILGMETLLIHQASAARSGFRTAETPR